jgi:intein-encoded DNA endonuclease-like protein
MLNQSNRNIPTRRVEFQNVQIKVTARFQDDHSVVKTEGLRFSADLDQQLDHAFLMSHADMVFKFWDILDVELVHSFVDSTDQYLY